MEDYLILDNKPDTYDLTNAPNQLWLLLALEIVISDEHGESLLLTYPSYDLSENQEMSLLEGGYWAPPFWAYRVDTNNEFSVYNTVGSVKECFNSYEKGIDETKIMSGLAYTMGIQSGNIKLSGEVIEYKRSPRTPNIWKCYKIKRYSYTNLSGKDKKNLADSECRKGYVFLPLYNLENVLKEYQCNKHGKKESLFLSKPIHSNVTYILNNYCDALKANAIRLDKTDYRKEEEGLIMSFDLSGFGSVCKYASTTMHSFQNNGLQIATNFRESVASLFYDFFSDVGVTQVHMAGDGFMAAIPKRYMQDSTFMQKFFQSYFSLLKKIDTFNVSIKDDNIKVGSRIAINHGQYVFGRIALSKSFSADFDGADIIETARLEGGLREYTKGGLLSENNKDLQHKHTLILTSSFKNKSQNIIDKLTFIETVHIKVKESDIEGHIYSVDTQNEITFC